MTEEHLKELIGNTQQNKYNTLTHLFRIIDPTSLNKQAHDVGTQYRSAIFYHNEQQRVIASQLKHQLNDQKIWDAPIVTEITAFKAFYKAEDYHQNYYNQNQNQGYCQFVIVPKLKKFEKLFSDFIVK